METLSVNIGGKAYDDAVRAFSDLGYDLEEAFAGSAKPVSGALRRTLQRVATEMENRHSSPWNGRVKNDKDTLQKRSGGGLASIRQSIKIVNGGNADTMEGRISTGKMTVHETGATVRAKSAGYLTIPLPPAMDSRGVPLKRRARDWANTFVAKSRKGNLIIFQKKGRKNIAPLYLLRKEVKIPKRLGMQEVVTGQAVPYFEMKAFDAIERYIERNL